MQMKTTATLLALIIQCFFCIGCGTEVVNPKSPVEESLVDGLVYFSKANQESDITGAPTSSTSDTASSQNQSKDFLLKLTSKGTIEPALTLLDEDSSKIPTVLRISIVGGTYFALLDKPILINNTPCTLVSFNGEKIGCMDSREYPVKAHTYNSVLPRLEDAKIFSVVKSSLNGFFYPISTTTYAKYGNSKSALAENVNNTTSLFSPIDYFFEHFYQNEIGDIFSTKCRTNAEGMRSHLLCKITKGEVQGISPALDKYEVDDYNIQPLSDGRIIVSYNRAPKESKGINNLHLRIGRLGVTIDHAFGDQDLKDQISGHDLEKTYGLNNFFKTGDGRIFGIRRAQSLSKTNIYQLYPSFASYLGNGDGLTAVEYHANSPVVIFYQHEGVCQMKIVSKDSDFTKKCPGQIKVITSKFIDQNTLVLGGPQLKDPSTYRYYRFNIETDEQKLLFETSDPMYIHAF